MTYLLDVSTLLALLMQGHEHHERATAWQNNATEIAVCPITEIGFLRISTQPVFGVTVDQARTMLRDWKAARKPAFVTCDVEALQTTAPETGTKTTDFYLAGLADAHGMKLATLENNMGHKAAFTLP